MGHAGDIAGFMLRADTKGKHREQDDGKPDQKNRPAAKIEKGMSGLSLSPQWLPANWSGSAPPLLPFGHAALKTGFIMLQPIASKPLRADNLWKIISPL